MVTSHIDQWIDDLLKRKAELELSICEHDIVLSQMKKRLSDINDTLEKLEAKRG